MTTIAKADIRRLLLADDREALRAMAGRSRRTLSLLMSLTYDPDELVAWRAAEAMGVAAGVILETDPEFVRGVLRRLMWSLNDESGGIGWKSPQAMGAMVAARPDELAEFAPILVSLFEIEEETFRPGTLWAVARVAARAPHAMASAAPWALQHLRADDAETRAYACLCVGQMGLQEAAPALRALVRDEAPTRLYRVGALQERTVGEAAALALAQLTGEAPQPAQARLTPQRPAPPTPG